MRIEEIYQTLHKLGLARSQVEFSRLWLGRSARYYSSMLARQHQPSLGTLTGLSFRLRNILAHTNEGEARYSIFVLIQQLDDHVTRRVVSDGALRRKHAKPAAPVFCIG